MKHGFIHILRNILSRQNNAILQQVVDMQQLLFFSRVAFICNVCFLLTAILPFIPSLKQGHLVSTILVLGMLVSFVLNALINLVLAILLLRRKKLQQYLPAWLMIFNLLCLVPQLIFFLR